MRTIPYLSVTFMRKSETDYERESVKRTKTIMKTLGFDEELYSEFGYMETREFDDGVSHAVIESMLGLRHEEVDIVCIIRCIPEAYERRN